MFLGRIVDEPLLEAVRHTRGSVAELFHCRADGTRVERMSFAVEVLLGRSVTDAFGDIAPVRHSRLRYEVTIELRSNLRGERPYICP
ncbi:MAG: hypothetical protein JXA67_09505 [Micromonosporaceae bacterium]|nr:hypothetical protein [Micromonosporaceae bacterium]